MTNEVVSTQHQSVPAEAGTAAAIFSPDGLDRLLRFADVMAQGKATVPAHLAGKPSDCLAVAMQSAQWGMNPFAVAQKTHLVNGVLGYEAQLVNAVVSSSSLLATRLNYQWDGDWSKVNGKTDKSPGLQVSVWATLKGESEPRCLTISMAQAGVRNSPLWEQDPRQQLAYLATKRWARLHTPDVLLGVYTPDELETVPRQERDITPNSTENLNHLISGASNHPAELSVDSSLISSLEEKLNSVDSLESAQSAGEAISQAKDSLPESTFRSLRAKAVKSYKRYEARNTLEDLINNLDPDDQDSSAKFQQVEEALRNQKNLLGEELFEGFSLTLNDMRAEYQ